MPEWTSALRARLEPLRLPAAKEAAIVEELSQHLDDRRAELIAGGLDEAAATTATFGELARADLLAPRLAAVHPPTPLEPLGGRRSRYAGLLQDLRYATRALSRQPGFSFVAIVTLALGIGLNAAMFGFLNAMLLRPLPFPDAAAIARLYRTTPDNKYGAFAPADYLALQQEAGSSMRVAAYRTAGVSISDPGQSAEWYVATAGLFDVIGLPPILGRVYTAADEAAGTHRVAVLSYACWQSRFGADEKIVGKTVRGNDEVYEIIGVLSPAAGDQRMFGTPGLFSPLLFSAADREERSSHALNILVRRSPSTSAAQGETVIRALGARLATEFPAANERTAWRSEPLPPSTVGSTGRAILGMLLGLSGLVLLIACSNLANLLLTRALDRTRELAVRTALGASRTQLVRAIVIESALLATAGALGAFAIATWTTGWLRSTIINSGGPSVDFSLDWRVLGFTLLTSLLTLFLCALGPILFAGRMRTGETLRSGGRGSTTSRRHQRLRYALITAQFALAMMLLASSGYFIRGTANLVEEHFGWKADHLVQAELTLPEAVYPKNDDIVRFHRALIERVERLPGVAAVSVSYGVPHMGLRGFGRFVSQPTTNTTAGSPTGASQTSVALGALVNGVSPDYFDVTQTRVLAGRVFDEHDTETAPPVVIVSESLARVLFPSGSPIGRRVAPAEGEPRQGWEVIGVVQDVRPLDVAREPHPYQLYQATAQDPRRAFTLAARTTGAPGEMAPSIRAVIADLDKDVGTRRLMSATARLQDITATMGLVRRLLAGFALLGLGLAALGIYGAMTRMVAQRTDEIGLRMALGARAHNVIGLVLAAGGRIVVVGAAFGVIGAFGLARLLRSVLPGLQVDAWQVGAAATLILIAMALVACYRPASRATSIDPMTALRSE